MIVPRLAAALITAALLVASVMPAFAIAQDDTIFFVVDADVAAQLAPELTRFMDDVATDTGARTVLVAAPASAAELRQALRDAWLHDGLRGAFFIGSIPYVYQTMSSLPALQATDVYYHALDCPFVETAVPGVVEASPWFPVLSRCRASIWTSRIRPTLAGTAGIEQVRSYLDKNHRLRNDPDHYDDSMVLQAAIPRDLTADFAALADAAFATHPLYARSQVRVIQQADALEQKRSFVLALQENVELLTINVHGSPQLIQFQSATTDAFANMTLDEFAELRPGAKVIQFLSCAVGDPGGESIASRVLFDSDTLLVEAAYTNIVVTGDYYEHAFRGRYSALGQGLSFADIHTNAVPWGAMYYFGDPTVRLAPRATPGVAPRLRINGEEPGRPFQLPVDAGIVAGSGIARVPIEVENVGNATLTLAGDTAMFPAIGHAVMRNGIDPVRDTSDFVFKMDDVDSVEVPGYRVSIPPGAKRTLHLLFNPIADYASAANTLYSAQLPFVTNDPRVGQFMLLPQGSHVRTSEPPPTRHGYASDTSLTLAVFGGGVMLGNWANAVSTVPAGALADVGGVALVDARHVGRIGSFYVWINIEGLGWYYQDAAGIIRFLGRDYEPSADPALARARNVTLPAKQAVTVLDDFPFSGRGLEGRNIELVFGYSLQDSPVLQRNAGTIRFTVQ